MAPRRKPAPAATPLVHAPFVCPELATWNERWSQSFAVESLIITCRMLGAICIPDGQIALDGLLAAAVVMVTGQPPALTPKDCAPVEIPVQREPGGRFHLASFALFDVERHAVGWTNRRFPLEQAQEIGDPKLRRINLSTGPCKSYRIPRAQSYLRDGVITWYAIGAAEPIRELLAHIGYLGKKRSVGLGRVVPGSWLVEPCDPWDGFPVVRDGHPLRALPSDWHGLTEYEPAYRTLTYPYSDRARLMPCAIPVPT